MADDKIKTKKWKLKIKKDGALKNKEFWMIDVTGGYVPRDTLFPIGEDQFFSPIDVEKL